MTRALPLRWIYPSPTGRIDAVVVDYDTPDLAARCLDSLTGCPLFASIAVVDAKALDWSYAQSVNTALKAGSAPIVLALNADTRMLEPPHAILDLFDADDRIAVVGPRQVTEDGRIVHGGIFGEHRAPQFRCWQAPLADHDAETADTRDALTVSGSVYFCRRTAWKELGGFLHTPRMFYEETFTSLLAAHRGYRVVYTGETTWIHHFASTPGVPRGEFAVESRRVFDRACARAGIAY